VEFLQFVALRRSDPTLAPRERGMLDVTGATEGFVRFIAEETGITLGWPPE
jgi:hypothetical protein